MRVAAKGVFEMLFILGSADAEMNRIEEVVRGHGHEVRYATKDDQRVRPWEANKADPIGEVASDVVLVECNPVSYSTGHYIQIDHHNPGDSGYNVAPAGFWHASSLGQVYKLLEIAEAPHDDLVLAAMDHCPADAIVGRCPGVEASEVLDRKISELSSWLKQPVDLIRIRILEGETLIKDMPTLVLAGQEIKDCRSVVYGGSNDFNLRCASIAALHAGYAVLFRQQHDGKEEWSLQGHCVAPTVEAFMQEWGPAQGLEGIYGVPSRGYAGGYSSMIGETNERNNR